MDLLTNSPAIQRSVDGLRRRETEMLLRKARSENLGLQSRERKKEKKVRDEILRKHPCFSKYSYYQVEGSVIQYIDTSDPRISETFTS